MCVANAPDARGRCVCNCAANCRARKTHAPQECTGPLDWGLVSRRHCMPRVRRVRLQLRALTNPRPPWPLPPRVGPCMCEGDKCEDHVYYSLGPHFGLGGNCSRKPLRGKWRCEICETHHSSVADFLCETLRLDAADIQNSLSEPMTIAEWESRQRDPRQRVASSSLSIGDKLDPMDAMDATRAAPFVCGSCGCQGCDACGSNCKHTMVPGFEGLCP